MKDLFITCPYGFEALLKKELETLGICKVFLGFCGVFIAKTEENVWIANYQSRVATRVLWPLAEFYCQGKEDLYSNCKNIPWSSFLNCHRTFAIDSNVQHPTLKNSLFASLVVKDAICDFFREKTGARPSIDTKEPDVQLNLFIQKGKATLYLDTSGAPLHKRGWRESGVEATLHESLAAALLLLTGYSTDKIFCDPFCGSGTFLIEAGLIATNTQPGFLRKKWGFFLLPGFDKKKFLEWKASKDSLRVSVPKGKIFGAEKSRETADACKKHIQKAGLSDVIEIEHNEIAYYSPKIAPNFIVTNPPYGKRLEISLKTFQEMKQFLENKIEPSSSVFLLSHESALLEESGLQLQEKFHFKNGGLPVQLLTILPN